MIAKVTPLLASFRLVLLPLAAVGLFAATAFGQAAAPLYRVAGKTSGKAVPMNSAALVKGRTTSLDRASLASLTNLGKGMQVTLPLTDAESVAGTVNLVRVEHGWTRSGGSLASGTPGTFYLSTNGARVEGFILRPDRQTAFRFETRATGETVLHEVPINAVMCGAMPLLLNDPKPAHRRAANEAAVVPPILNSRPDAVATVYLDFDGETVTDPAWDGGNTIVAPPPDVSTDDINDIFARVKEDYWAFNLNVTTDVNKYNNAPVGKRMRCIITPNDAAGRGAGGIAYVGSFAQAGDGFFTDTIPCWVFNGGVVGIAEAVSHELGHTFGLIHDGRELPTTGHEEYFLGQGTGPTSWCPIMGAAYYVNVSQWSKGEYQYANNQQDDVGIISGEDNGFGYVTDEAGDTIGTAVPLGGNNADGTVNQSGVVTVAGETDFYALTTTGGNVTLSAVGAPDPNLDISMELQSSAGSVLASANPANSLSASLTTNVPRGTYFLKITDSGAGDPFTTGYSTYSSIGAYTITGTVPGFGVQLLPNLAFATPTGSTDKLVISTMPGTTTDSPTFYAEDTLYLDFAVTSNGDAPVTSAFDTLVYVDDVLRGTVTTPAGLAVGVSATTLDFNLGSLSTGPHTIRLQADGNSAIAETNETDNSYSRTIMVTEPGPPAITSATSASGNMNVLFYYAIIASNQPTYTVDGLPAGLYLKPGTNIITGTPTVAGIFNVTLTATNVLGSDTKTLTLTIIPAAPVITNPGTISGVVGTAFSYGIAASNNPAGYAVTGLPPGLTLNGLTGVISGTPTTAGTYAVALTATNAGGSGTATVAIQILVPAPVLTSAASAQGRVGMAFTFQVTATNTPTSYGADGLPAGLSIDPVTGLISGTPTTAGTYAVTVNATNSNRTVTAPLSLTIADSAPITAWGAAEAIAVPDDLETGNVVALTAGASHSVALRSDGTVEAWGVNNAGQLNVPAGLSDVVSVAAGAYHNLALRRDGTVVAWGQNDQGQTSVPTGLKGVVAISAGAAHSLALRSDGTVVAWGSNVYGQAAPPTNLTGVVGIAAGGLHSLALRGDGTVAAWGSNGSGQLGIPATLTGVKQVAAGADFSLILRQTGSVVVLGSNSAGQLALPAGLLDVTAIAAGGQHALALHQDGTVTAWGSNSRGESIPPTVLYKVAAIAAGGSHSLALVQGGAPRVIAAMPSNGTAVLGQSVSLLAYGVGTGALGYQWTHEGQDIVGATSPFLFLNDLQTAQAGAYAFRLTNAAGSVVSPATTLTLTDPLPVVSVEVSTPNVAVGSATYGAFTLTRTGEVTGELIVNYSVKGTGINGTDYKLLKGSKKFKAGKVSVKVKVTPMGNLEGQSKKVVKFTLLPGDGYTVSTPDPVKVKILGAQP